MCVILHVHACTCMSVIPQDGDSALMYAARWGWTKVVIELVKARSSLNLQNTVCQYVRHAYIYMYMKYTIHVHVYTKPQNSVHVCTCTVGTKKNFPFSNS